MITIQLEKLLIEHKNSFYINNVMDQYICDEDYKDEESLQEAVEEKIEEVKRCDMESENENYCFDN